MHTCLACHIGTLQRKTAAYAAWHDDDFVVIPGMPTWVCDVCGERTYDGTVLDALLSLIGPPSPASDADDSTDVQRGPGLSSLPGNTRTRRRA